MEFEKMKTETIKLMPNFQKIESEYDALRQDVKTLNQKIDEGLQRCFEDSEKLVRSMQQQTVSNIKEEIEGDIQAELANTKLDIVKVVDNKFFMGEDEGSDTSWAKVVGKHVEACIFKNGISAKSCIRFKGRCTGGTGQRIPP